MGAALNLLIGGPALLIVLFALVSVFLQVWIPVQDLFEDFEMANVFIVFLRRNNICGSDQLG